MLTDIRVAVRQLRHDRWFTVLAAVALGLGIGVNHTFFTLVHAAVLRGLPIEAADRVMFLSLRDARNAPRRLTHPEYDDLRRDSRTFEHTGAFTTSPMTLIDEEAPPDRVFGASLSASGLRALGVVPRLGRSFLADDDRPGAQAVVLLSDDLWRTRYGGDPSVVGRTITLDGEAATVAGVMPEGFRFPGDTAVWRPLAAAPAPPPQNARALSVFGRLHADATREQAQAEFESIVDVRARTDPASYGGLRPSAVPINDYFMGRVTDTVWLAFITAGLLVLLIACANVANLLLMRAASRGREVAVRMSLGATRAHILRQLLAESSVLAALGAAAGVLFSYLGLELLGSMVPADVARLFAFTLEPRVLLALLGAAAGSVAVFGLAPAVHLARGSPAVALRHGGGQGEAVARRRWTTAFLAAEFALTLVLLANVADSVRTVRAAQDAQFSIDPAPLLTMSITLPNQPYDTPGTRNRFFDRLDEAIAALPPVSAVTVTSALPGSGGEMREVTVAGRRPESPGPAPTAITLFAGDGYFETIGAPLLRGRPFARTDGTPGNETAIVSQRLATLFFPGEDPLGRLIRLSVPGQQNGEAAWLRIVGVAPSLRQSQQGGIEPDPVAYLPVRSAAPPAVAVIVRTGGDPPALTPPIREAVRRLDPSLPVYGAMTMTEALRRAQWNGRISRVLLNGIGTIALLLALVGLYAVTAHSIRLRRKELGIRVALGARPGTIGTLVLRRAMVQLGIGLAAGIAATVAFDRLFTTGPTRLTDPNVLMPTLAAIVAVGLTACLWPASRAARLDPLPVLRQE